MSPFEPAYEVFVRLCLSLPGNPLLPRIDLDVPLAGGGRLTLMEFLTPAEPDEAAALGQRWAVATPGDSITEVRERAEQLNAEAAELIPFWGGLDDNPHNVMKDGAGALKLVDLFYAAGVEIYRLLLEDPAAIAGQFAPDQREYICDSAVVARQFSTADIAALRAAASSISREQRAVSPQGD